MNAEPPTKSFGGSFHPPKVPKKPDDAPSMGTPPLSHATQLAHSGIQRGAERMMSAVQAVQRGDLVDAAMEQSKARAEITASSKLARAMDETLGTLIDELA